jgi:hypothetical protein
VRTHPPPPEMGGGRAVYRRLPDRGSDKNQKSKSRLIHKNSGRYIIFPRSEAAPLGASRILAVRYCLTLDEWDWLRWLPSLTIGVNGEPAK